MDPFITVLVVLAFAPAVALYFAQRRFMRPVREAREGDPATRTAVAHALQTKMLPSNAVAAEWLPRLALAKTAATRVRAFNCAMAGISGVPLITAVHDNLAATNWRLYVFTLLVVTFAHGAWKAHGQTKAATALLASTGGGAA